MKKIFLFVFTVLSLYKCADGQQLIFSGTTGAINDVSTNMFTTTVSGISSNTIDSVYGIKSVFIDLTHTWDGDMQIYLMSPAGVIVDLAINAGGSGDDFDSTTFMQSANTDIFNTGAPFNGTFRPFGWLGTFNNGENPNGVWKLFVNDIYGGDVGTLFNWKIMFDTMPAHPFNFTSSNLPIVKVYTNAQHIIDYPALTARMQIINNAAPQRNYYTDVPNGYNGFVGIQYRGSSSQSFPQKSYGFSTLDTFLQNYNFPILGMPSNEDWILYAPWDDKSLMRNTLTYKLGSEMGHWTPRCNYVELFINDEYEGVYVLMEKIKRDPYRVNIDHLYPTDTTGAAVTGGYICKIDKTTGVGTGGWHSSFDYCGDTALHSKLYFQYDEPRIQVMPQIQQDYIAGYVDSFEQRLYNFNLQDTISGWRHYFSEKDAIDFSISNEVAKNIDGYRLSTYFNKDRNEKLKMGPLWDFNLTYGNANYLLGFTPNGWYWQHSCSTNGDHGSPFWWYKFWTDTTYKKHYACRWTYLRDSTMKDSHVNYLIDSMATLLNESQARTFTRWQILGQWLWPNAYVGPTWQSEVDTLKGWMHTRMIWMDQQLPVDSNCIPPHFNIGVDEPFVRNSFNLFPNPAQQNGFVDVSGYAVSGEGKITISLMNINGVVIKSWTTDAAKNENYEFLISLRSLNLAQGIYILQVQSSSFSGTRKLVIE